MNTIDIKIRYLVLNNQITHFYLSIDIHTEMAGQGSEISKHFINSLLSLKNLLFY